MGCNQSKIENEEAVSRCKDRKQFMKEAVTFRNAFAAAHSSYAVYLKNTGAALSDYAQGEVVGPHPAHQPNSASAAAVGAGVAAPLLDPFPPPPPPLPEFSGSPLLRAASMPEIKADPKPKPKSKPKPIIEGDEDDEEEVLESSESLRRRSKSSRSKQKDNRDLDAPPPAPSQSTAVPVSVESRTVPPLPQHTDTPYHYFFSVDVPAPTLDGAGEIDQKVFEERPKSMENDEEEENEREVFEERPNGVENYEEEEEVVKRSPKVEEVIMAPPPPLVDEEASGSTGKSLKKAKAAVPKGSVNMLQIFADLDDHFLKASESAHEVSKMLEATRLHYHSNFADNRGHIDHSARVMRVITWNRSFRGVPNVDDGKDDIESEEHETHATVLDKLLAWEKKLYDEVKAGELMKYEYQKKVSSLNKVKKRGTNSEALEKAKAAVSHLHTRYIVDMQSMDSTVSEINSLRDEQLYPKLVQLVEGMATMWETMRGHHEKQSKIVIALRSFDMTQCPKQTSEHHHERTIQLFAVVQEWHSQFEKLVNNQKDYIKALKNWLKLNLIPIESSLKEKVSSPPRIQRPPIQGLLLAWHDHLEKLPDDVARTAIHNFAAVINTIMIHQEEEMKMKDKCEETRKDLARKRRHFEDWYNKNLDKTIRDEQDPDREGHTRTDVVAEKQFVVDQVKKKLEEEEEAYELLCLQVREKSITSLKTRLPELFRALSDFSFSCSEMYKGLRPRSPHNPSVSSAR